MHTAFTPFATSFATWFYKRESNGDITRTKGEWRGDARLHRRLSVQNGSSWYTRDFPNPVDRVCGRWTECGRRMRMVDGVRTAYADGGRSADGVCGRWTECGQRMWTVDGVRTAYADGGWSGDSVFGRWTECEMTTTNGYGQTVNGTEASGWLSKLTTWNHVLIRWLIR